MTTYRLGDNPFKRDEHGNIPSVDMIAAVIRRDLALATRLAKEAGEPISNWMPNNPQ